MEQEKTKYLNKILLVIPENFLERSDKKFIWNLTLQTMSLLSKLYCIYIMASKKNGILYIGVTSNLQKRVWEHKNNIIKGFTKKYFIHRLVYFEQTENVYSALAREKQLKKWNRS